MNEYEAYQSRGCGPTLVIVLVVAILFAVIGAGVADSVFSKPVTTNVTVEVPSRGPLDDLSIFERVIIVIMLPVLALGGLMILGLVFVVGLNNTTQRR